MLFHINCSISDLPSQRFISKATESTQIMFLKNTREERENRETQKKYTKIFLGVGFGLFSVFFTYFCICQIFYNEHILFCFDLENIIVYFKNQIQKCPRVSEPNLKKKKKKKKKTYIRAGWVSEWEILYIKVRLNGVLFCLHGKWFTLEEKCRIGFVRELEIQEFCKVLNGSVFKIYLCLFHFYRFLHFWFLLVALVFKISDPL